RKCAEALDVRSHDGGRREPAEARADRGRVASPERHVLRPEPIEKRLRLEKRERLVHERKLERIRATRRTCRRRRDGRRSRLVTSGGRCGGGHYGGGAPPTRGARAGGRAGGVDLRAPP